MTDLPKAEPKEEAPQAMERREFLRKCGKYAVVVPPTMTLLLAKSDAAFAGSCITVTTSGDGWTSTSTHCTGSTSTSSTSSSSSSSGGGW